MAIKIVLRKRKNSDGTRPLILQVWKDGKRAITNLGYSIDGKDWDKKTQLVKTSHPNSGRMNQLLLSKRSEATDGALMLEAEKKGFSPKAVIRKIKPATGSTFFPQADEYLAALKAGGKYNQYTADKPRIGHFKEFLKNGDIAFSDITSGLLEKFVVWLKSAYKPKRGKKKRIGDRTVANHLVVVRSVFAHARKNGLVKKEQSPFGEGGMKISFPDSSKVGIEPEDVETLENFCLLDPKHEHARKLWLFSFYFAGMRVSDVLRLKWTDFTNYRLHYSMGKNDKGGSLKIPDKAVAILKHYEQFKADNGGFVFPELKGVDLSDEFTAQRTIAFKTSALDKILRLYVAPAAEIDKKLTMHISRHTFGSMAGDAIPIQMLQKLYRHSHVSTTIAYQANYIHKDADDALDAVIGRVNKSTQKPE
jgi:integrase/recombinase XerD